MNDETSPLAQLGTQAGLLSTYTDYWGQEQHLSERSLQTLLGAIGVDTGSEQAVREALSRMKAEQGRPRLGPLKVLRQNDEAGLAVGEEGAHAHRWRLTLESGQEWAGAIADGRIGWPSALPAGYHTLDLLDASGAPQVTSTLAVCPPRCFEPGGLAAGERWWGPTVQLYALRSERNWGMGDFTDLLTVIDLAARQGAAFVGLNPLHALFPHEAERASPYSPSSRSALNVFYLDVEVVADFDECEEAAQRVQSVPFQRRLHDLRQAAHIDYQGVWSAKREVLDLLYAHFRRRHLDRRSARGAQFRAFQRERGRHLRAQALFDAIQEAQHAQDASIWGWIRWPEAYRDPTAPAVAAFEREHLPQVEFFEYLQWQAELQLEAAKRRARARGLPLGLYLDVAVGVNEGGAETWADHDAYALGVHVGAPCEEYNPSGQDWGLPPLVPSRLKDRGYAPFIDMLRANMRHAGALRLDHVMALSRLFWVPPQEGPKAGTYMSYPLEDLLGLLALESHRHRCLVIGEDLGTVPPNFREVMGAHHVFSYCPLYFERVDGGGFKPPAQWKPHALAVVGTHDLPTLRAWWRGDDIEIRTRLHLFAKDEQRQQQVVDRANERVQLLLLLENEGLWPQGSSTNPGGLDDTDPRFTEAVYTLIGRSRAQLVGVQFEDVVQQLEQVNVPSTTESQHPNWRVKLALTLEALAADPRWHSVAAALRQARPRASAFPLGAEQLPPLGSAHIPRATYRIQFHAGMRFVDACRAVPYLAALGVSHLYASPYLKARAGSTHGYDIVDHNALNPEIGTPQEHDDLCDRLARHGMQQLLDIVPNHMGVLEADNAWWLDVLECGPASVHAQTFDIEWQSTSPELRGQVLLPVLGDHYGRVLEAGELKLGFDAPAGEFALHYYDHRFPIDPRQYPEVFAAAAPVGTGDELAAIQSLIDAFGRLPDRHDDDEAARALRQRDKPLLKQRLAELHGQHESLRGWVEACLAALNGQAGQPASFDRLDQLIRRQAYRLAFWRVAGDDVNYRRFFDINTLAAVRMERDEVFEATHRTVLAWLAQGRLTGLRVDHPDGLSDPQGYFERLQHRYADIQVEQGQPPRALYIAVEKILAEHERVPADWPVHGGTGYRFSNVVNGVFVDAGQEGGFDQLYEDFIGERLSFDEILREAKLLIMSTSLASDLQILTEAIYQIAQTDRRTRDFTRNGLRHALVEIAAGFPVYRTYIGPRGVTEVDRRHVDWAVAEARRRSLASELNTIGFVRDVLLQAPDEPDEARRGAMLAFVRRWQQFTAPVMAKAMEDTAFYRYHRLISLNDVGGDPRRFGVSVAAFHSANLHRARQLPHTMLGTSTHDSKRSEDVRARLDVLSEIPEQWAEALQRWSALNRPRASRGDAAIDPNDEYLLYQTLVGVWPLAPLSPADLDELRGRVQAYMLKAVREAKQHTSWINPDQEYEAALARFIDQLLGVLEPNPFIKDLQAFVEPVGRWGCANALNQALLKLTVPGVPDIYQGCEVWNFSLVDPDNRRPVDFQGLEHLLQEVQAAMSGGQLAAEVLKDWGDMPARGHLKMLLTWRLLQLRQRAPQLFECGGYRPLEVRGGHAVRHVIAFARLGEGQGEVQCVVLATRLPATLSAEGKGWQHDEVAWTSPEAEWADWITGRPLPTTSGPNGERALALSSAFGLLPLAVAVPAGWLTSSSSSQASS